MHTTKTNTGTREEIAFVVRARVISAALIYLCHLTQTHSNTYVVMISQILNVGVYIFLVISGFLFGRMGVKKPYHKWLGRRLTRIFLPYWVFLTIHVLLQILHGTELDPVAVGLNYLGVQWFDYLLPGADHIWFISAILLCYGMTPVLDWVTDKLLRAEKKIGLRVFAAALLLSPLAIGFLPGSAIVVTVPVYALAFLLGRIWDPGALRRYHGLAGLFTIAAAFGLRFLIRLVLDETVWYSGMVVPYTHAAAAFGFFIAMACFRDKKPGKGLKRISDISFEIYLYHYLFLLPPLSVMELTGSWGVNGVLAAGLSVLTAYGMNRAVNGTRKRLQTPAGRNSGRSVMPDQSQGEG